MGRIRISDADVAARRAEILQDAKWCFLNFGFDKTSFEDIAKRAGLSRTLLYRTFRNKDDIFTAVFADWLIARHPEALRISNSGASKIDRLIAVCRLLVLEPWGDILSAPMGNQFFNVCERLDPVIENLHRQVNLQCVTLILGDAEKAELFLLAVDGAVSDEPAVEALERRIKMLATLFVAEN